jgi:hypothetical protein
MRISNKGDYFINEQSEDVSISSAVSQNKYCIFQQLIHRKGR